MMYGTVRACRDGGGAAFARARARWWGQRVRPERNACAACVPCVAAVACAHAGVLRACTRHACPCAPGTPGLGITTSATVPCHLPAHAHGTQCKSRTADGRPLHGRLPHSHLALPPREDYVLDDAEVCLAVERLALRLDSRRVRRHHPAVRAVVTTTRQSAAAAPAARGPPPRAPWAAPSCTALCAPAPPRAAIASLVPWAGPCPRPHGLALPLRRACGNCSGAHRQQPSSAGWRAGGPQAGAARVVVV